MTFLQQLKWRLMNFMRGRNGMDQLALTTLMVSLALQLIGSLVQSGALMLLSLALYGFTLFRIFSRKSARRMAENAKFTAWRARTVTRVRQWFLRLKHSRQYKYFKCPQCGVLLRISRGAGERDVSCPQCHCQFRQRG